MTCPPEPSPVAGSSGTRGVGHHYRVINGVRLHTVEYGKGPLVLLLHGFPEFWYAWRYQIPALAEAGFRVIAPDLRGYNTSDKPRGVRQYRMTLLVEDVLGLMHAAGAERAVLAGHDWGGVIAWYCAMRHPEAVLGSIILNAPHPQRYVESLRTFRQLRKSWYAGFFQFPWLPEWCLRAGGFARLEHLLRQAPVPPDTFSGDTIRQYRQALSQPGALTAALHYYRSAFRDLLLGTRLPLCRIDSPTLLIWGEQDQYLDISLSTGLEPWVSQLTVERLPDASHWVQAEAPERVNTLMLEFLRTRLMLPGRR